MSKIDNLIKELCPNGVEYKSIAEIATRLKGMSNVSNKWLDTGNCQFIDYMNAYKNMKIDIDNLPFATVKNKEGQIQLKKGDILFTSASETPDECAISSVIEDELKSGIFMDDHLFGIRLKKEFKDRYSVGFLKHYFRGNKFRENVAKTVRGVTRFYVSKPDFIKIQIPIPPIEIQNEIVRILDKFSTLEAELEAELETREKQYEFWRGKLLFSKNYEINKMSEICIINQGLQIPINKRKLNPGKNRYFYITVQFLKHNSENYYIENPRESVICHKDDILVTRTGSTGKIITGVEGCFHNNFFKVNPIIEINKKYLFYVLSSKKLYKEMLRIASGGTVPDLPHSKFYDMNVPIPSFEEQNEIVKILDKFDKLINDISEGIPAEIKYRTKQYEYYRNKLLNFEEIKEGSKV
jgi:type I restriction enzyme, S subunit